ncbi:MAG: ParB N-terminal domain-containing protein [Candidatus Hydrogenedentes bacterium]|nr:ParB N-terminal domain-containing protein [Candidatus Hydrogenedentota bacterium]
MPTAPKIEYKSVDILQLDPTNPRLGRHVASPKISQAKVLDIMSDWTLDELAESFLQSGFWPQEALIVVKEKLYGKDQFVVVEGNRRLAALKYLKLAVDGKPSSSYWAGLVDGKSIDKALFDDVPYIEVKSREDVAAYLGFRHVTGIKEWNPAEKAEFISKLIEESKLSYEEVSKKIGSKAPTVRQHYISYRLLLQMEQQEDVSIEAVEEKFSVLYLSLRTQGAQKYLHIDIQAPPNKAKTPVPKEHVQNLVNFSRWLFGDEKHTPLFTDSRNVDAFGRVLESDEGVEYLERTENPRFELALRKAGVGEQEIVDLISGASDNVQLALTEAHVYRKSDQVQKAVRRLGIDLVALLNVFPAAKADILKELGENAGAA